MDLNLSGRVAVITGGASGIGRAVAAAFAGRGRARGRLGPGRRRGRRRGRDPRGVPRPRDRRLGRRRRRGAVAAALERTVAELGPIDHVVHAAAIGSGKFGFPFTNLRPADWPRVLRVNVMGMVERRARLRAAHGRAGDGHDGVPRLGRRADRLADRPAVQRVQGGEHQLRPVPGEGPGPARRPGEHGLPGHGADGAEPIGVAGVARPGPAGGAADLRGVGGRKVRRVVPLGRWQTPEDIAAMVVFLASERAANVTGQTINVDGGFVMHW